MKKKILIALLMVVIACLFALTVSASNEVTLTDDTTANIETVFVVDGSTVNGFNTGYSMENVKDVVFPESITTIKNISFQGSTVLESVTFESTTTLTLENVAFRDSSIQRATFNPNCELNYKSGSFYNCKSMTQITFPRIVSLTGNCFQFNKNMEPTNGIVFVEGITTINCHIFNGCTKVGGTVVFPSTLQEIKEGTFTGTSITAFDFSKCVNLTTIGGGYGGTFSNIDTVTSYDFSACTSLTTFNGPAMFEGSAELCEIILPPNLTKIPSKTLAHCYKLQSVVIPASVTEIVGESFHSVRANQSIKTFTMYIQGNVKLDSKYVFRDTSAKIEFVLLGDTVTAEQFKETNAGVDIIQSGGHSILDDIEVIDYVGEANPWTYVPGQAITSHVIVENYCTNLALKGEHKSGENPCVIFCEDCLFSQAKENPAHDLETTIKYANGFANVGEKLIACKNEGCQHKIEVEAKALFKCLGYSTQSYGNGGFSVSFAINYEAVDDYNTVENTTLTYGAFAVAQQNAQQAVGDEKVDKDIINADGTTAKGVASVDFSKRSYDIFAIRITGFETDEHKDVKLALGAYVIENGKVTYLQVGTPAEGNTYCYTSYNQQIQ